MKLKECNQIEDFIPLITVKKSLGTTETSRNIIDNVIRRQNSLDYRNLLKNKSLPDRVNNTRINQLKKLKLKRKSLENKSYKDSFMHYKN